MSGIDERKENGESAETHGESAERSRSERKSSFGDHEPRGADVGGFEGANVLCCVDSRPQFWREE